MPQIGDRRFEIRVQPGAVEHRVGAARRRHRLLARPAVARLDQPQIAQPAIEHRPRRRADILAHLRFDQDDRRPAGDLRLFMIGAGQPSPVALPRATRSRKRERVIVIRRHESHPLPLAGEGGTALAMGGCGCGCGAAPVGFHHPGEGRGPWPKRVPAIAGMVLKEAAVHLAPPPGRAARPVLKNDALGGEVVADAVGVGEAMLLAGESSGGDTFDRRSFPTSQRSPAQPIGSDWPSRPIRRPLIQATLAAWRHRPPLANSR